MKVSIITPTFNRVGTLKEAIKSVLLQTHNNWELIIQDGCLDNLAVRDEEFSQLIRDARITYLLGKDSGITNALNIAASKATGDIMVEMNDDDALYDENSLEVVNHFFNNVHDVEWIYSKMQYMDKDGVGGGEAGFQTSLEELLKGNTICQPTVFWRKSLFDRVGGFDESFPYAQDYELWIRFWKASPPYFLDIITAKYRIHEGSITSSLGGKQAEDAARVKQKHQ